MMVSQETENVLRNYLHRTLHLTEDAWRIDISRVNGRGLFATRDLQPGDVIFHDRAVALGPRLKYSKAICVGCHKTGSMVTCLGGCRLPVCSSLCSSSSLHTKECHYLKTRITLPEDGQYSTLLLQALTALRCLILEEEDKAVVRCLQHLSGASCTSIEVNILKKYLGSNLTLQEEEWIRLCCLTMDCNAFEALSVTGKDSDQTTTSLRGLFPLAAIMNHECSPNTYHTYNNQCTMKVRAARPIKQGEEITTSYTSLLWNTTIRRSHLQKTKQFLCECERCRDPTEFGSLLSSISCPKCINGIMLPISSLKFSSPWTCNACSSQISSDQVSSLHVAQGTALARLDTSDPETVVRFLGNGNPTCKQVSVQLKLGFIWQIGHSKGYFWEDLSIHLLDLKEMFCRQLLQLLDVLNLGDCRMKGLILFELHCTLCEKLKKLTAEENTKLLFLELQDTLTKALDIFNEDASAPQEVPSRLKDMRYSH